MSTTLTVPRRSGGRPTARPVTPHQQLDQNAPTALQEVLWSKMRALPHVTTGRSVISLPDTRALHLAAGVYARAGQRERALAVAERALVLRPREFATLYNVACAYAQLGEKERALAILEGFSELGQGSFDWIREDPDFASLHGDPRFERVVAHLSDVSKAAGTS